MDAKFAASAALMAAPSPGLGFVAHGRWSCPTAKGFRSLFRGGSDARAFFPFVILAHILIGIAFTRTYRGRREAKRPCSRACASGSPYRRRA
jgi:hypothetical protein